MLLLAVTLGAATVQAGAPAAAVELRAGTFDPPRAAPDFYLEGSNGVPLQLHSQRGKVVLLQFGFAHCQAVCPVTLSTLKGMSRQLGAQAREVQVVFVTVDPERDDAAALQRYLTAFDPSFLGGTGTEKQLAAVRKEYGVAAQAVAGPEGGYSHTSSVFLIDRRGRLRALMPYGRGVDDYVHDVRVLLAAP